MDTQKDKNGLRSLVDREPIVVIMLAANAVVLAVIGVMNSFGLGLSEMQVDAIATMLFAIANLSGVLYARQMVTPMRAPRTRDGDVAEIVAIDK